MKVSRTKLLRSGESEKELGDGECTGAGGCCFTILNRISMSEWVSIVAPDELVRRCVASRACRTYSERSFRAKTESIPSRTLGRRGCPAAISHCRCSARARIGVWIVMSGLEPSIRQCTIQFSQRVKVLRRVDAPANDRCIFLSFIYGSENRIQY